MQYQHDLREFQLKIFKSEDILANRSFLNSYLHSWEIAFNRNGYREKIIEHLKIDSYVSLMINKIDQIAGGLCMHYWGRDDYSLFNNLFSVKGMCDKPISTKLIKLNLSHCSNLAVGFPNSLARTPYRRCNFKESCNHIRVILNYSDNISKEESEHFQPITLQGMDFIYKSLLELHSKSYLANYKSLIDNEFFRWRYLEYASCRHDRKYMIVSTDNRKTNIAIVSIYYPSKRLHILYLDYTNLKTAEDLIKMISNYAINNSYKADIIIEKRIEERLLQYCVEDSYENPIIMSSYGFPQRAIILRDGDNDVY